jgi:hypothetical protein
MTAEDMTIAIDAVRDFFGAVLAQDAAALDRIEAAGAELELRSEGFVFSLPALHAMLDPEQNLRYRDFCKLLYASTLNEELAAFDAEVALHRSTGKIDSSLYCLRRRAEV